MKHKKRDPEHRQTEILDLARAHGRVFVDDLAAQFGASSETIRRDLNALAEAGALRKFHGGAQLPTPALENPFAVRLSEEAAAKRAIARHAASLFTAGDALFVDNGTTTLFFAEEMARYERLTVITNSVSVAGTLSGGNREVLLLGGHYWAEANETTGEPAIEQIKSFHVPHAVVTVGAIHPVHGVMNYTVHEAQISRAMIGQADRVTVIADHTKFGRSALTLVCNLKAVDRIVTDAIPAREMADAIERAGIELIIAGR